ncbi:MAG: histidine--tRNA ligase [Lentisphaerae bacterium]|nr:histidine--tRNA ligase [Lentisphaerota bacterium]
MTGTQAGSGSGFAAPRGMRDFYPEDMLPRERIFGAWRAAARLYGFVPYDACVIETLDLLKRKAGEEIVEQIYAFTDKSGRSLALRPEMTPTLARMIAARQSSLALPLKWFAIAQCFRYERMSKGRRREHYQWNLDVVGEPSVGAELEVVAAAAHALRALGFADADFKVHFSSRALLADVMTRLDVPPERHAAAFLALDKRDKIGEDATRAMLGEAGLGAAASAALLGLFGGAALDDVAGFLRGDSDALAGLREFAGLGAAYGLGDALRFDLSVVRGLAYYTGIVFEAYDAARRFRAIFGGGRYDNLLGELGGQPATGVGLGFGDVVVAEIMAERPAGASAPAPAGTAIGYMEPDQRKAAMRLAARIRQSGEPADLALRPEKARAFFSRANRGCFARAAYVGPDDVAAGAVRVKDLSKGTESSERIEAG